MNIVCITSNLQKNWARKVSHYSTAAKHGQREVMVYAKSNSVSTAELAFEFGISNIHMLFIIIGTVEISIKDHYK